MNEPERHIPDEGSEHTDKLDQLREDVLNLRDLFVRRLFEDKVKAAALESISDTSKKLQVLLEDKQLNSMFRELILVCDRIEAQESVNSFTQSIHEELLEILARRDVIQIGYEENFNPQIHNAVRTEATSNPEQINQIGGILRNGYMKGNLLFRPADVVVMMYQAKLESVSEGSSQADKKTNEQRT